MHAQYNNTHLVIIAGGIGQRLWPWSTKDLPKQFHDLLGAGKTLLQATVERFENLVPQDNIWIVTHTNYIALVKQQLPWINQTRILCEPIAKNTAPCIAYACHEINKISSEAILVVTPADHDIEKKELFIETVQQAIEFDDLSIALFGIPPKSPETGYGYISYDCDEKGPVRTVTDFVEKPPLEQAKRYLEQGNYVWNAGIFIGKVDTFIKNFKAYLPDVWQAFELYDSLREKDHNSLTEIYKTLPSISFDHGISEKTKDLHVIYEDIGWSDLGTWYGLYQRLNKDYRGNACRGKVINLATSNCLIKANSEQLIVTYGVENLVIIQHQNMLLICPQDEVQNLKILLKKMEDEGYEEYL